jgi:hypothetical protein
MKERPWVEVAISKGLLSPGARGMTTADILWQYAEINIISLNEAIDQLEARL